MSRYFTRAALVGAGMAVMSVPANAGVTFGDMYWGYTNPALSPRDVIGNMFFDVDQGFVERQGDNLIVQVLTKYTESFDPTPDNPQSPDINRIEGELDTFVGDLFLGTGGVNLDTSGNSGPPDNNPTINDSYSDQLDRWQYAVTSPDDQSVGTGEAAELRAITESDVQRSFYSDIGDPNNNSHRWDQQVLVERDSQGNLKGSLQSNASTFTAIQSAGNAAGIAWLGKDGGGLSTYKNGYGVLQWTVADFFKLDDFTGQNPSDRLTIGWAMTCANDTIINEVLLEELVTTDVPLPGGLPLFLSGLVGLGFLGRYRAKKRAETA